MAGCNHSPGQDSCTSSNNSSDSNDSSSFADTPVLRLILPACPPVPQELFAAMDTNQDGRIDSNDLHNALAKVRVDCNFCLWGEVECNFS